MCHHEGGGKNFEAEDAILRGIFEVTSEVGVFTSLFESLVNFLEDFDKVGTRAAAGIEDVDVFVRESVGKIQFLPKNGVHAGDHVLNNFRRGVPDPKLLAELGIESL